MLSSEESKCSIPCDAQCVLGEPCSSMHHEQGQMAEARGISTGLEEWSKL